MKNSFDNLAFSGIVNEDSELIPLVTGEDDYNQAIEGLPDILPILPLRNTVLFPGVVIPITVGRDKSIKLIQEAYKGNKIIGVNSQKDVSIEDPVFTDLNPIGTIATIIKMLKMPDGSTTAIIQGRKKFRLREGVQSDPYIKATFEEIAEIEPDKEDKEFIAMFSTLKESSLQIIEQSPEIPSEASFAVRNIESPSFLVNFVSSNMNATVAEKQEILEIGDLKSRATKVLELLNRELQMLELKNQIRSKVKTDMDRQQKEYFLNQQIKMIQEELGNDTNQEIEDMKTKAASKNWADKVASLFYKEISKLERMNPASADYSVQLNYLELVLELPWNDCTKDNFDLKRAADILDRDHYGMKKIKQRILEHLAVLKLKGDMKAPILCLVGPPGVGKTSLGKSVAEALGRKYARIALGGLKDESEIRGHRKTYIGAMPGRILQSLKKVQSSNPVFILDELDKLGNTFQGDPSSALLEVLDPEQNNTFHDNFLDIEYDLSKVLFIATANSLSTIQPALRDRMEVIEMTGYSLEEKYEIAKKYLIPKQLKEHGLQNADVKISKSVLDKLIDEYTYESGVRGLERVIAQVVRSRAKDKAMDIEFNPTVAPDELTSILGPSHPRDKYIGNEYAGVVTGLAWTSAGGDILYIETSVSEGKGRLTLTGNLGDVMKESATIALEYFRAHSAQFGFNSRLLDSLNIHIHVPEGATPKDGPSAGITMFTSIASALTGRKVRKATAMTGEITLRGDVLPVGGIKEKILAARRAGVKEVILCARNEKDVLEIEPEYISNLTFHYIKNITELVSIALLDEKVKNARDFSKLKPTQGKS